MKTKKILFIYFDKAYVIYHSIGIAIELSKYPNTEVTILCDHKSYKLIKDILGSNDHNVNVIKIVPYWIFPIPTYLEIKIYARKFHLKKYKDLLAQQDIIVAAQYADIVLKKMLPEKIKIVYSTHGVNNRKYSFDDIISEFDLALLSSEWECKMRIEKKQLTKDNCVAIGYPKLDVIKKDKTKFFNNNRKTVIYIPHWERSHTSYFKYGREILDFFAKNKAYNLIFAPHSLLKTRYPKIYLEIAKFRKSDNILIDLGSEMASNMTYTRSADIFLGDFSSQALEFALLEKRPCIFINPDKNSDEIPISWGLGNVYDEDNFNIRQMLNEAQDLFETKYKKKQEKIIAQMFTLPEKENSSSFAAKKILQFID